MYVLALRRRTVRKDSSTPELRILTTLDNDWQIVVSVSFSCQITSSSRTIGEISLETILGSGRTVCDNQPQIDGGGLY